jgi:gluconolactonase
MNGKVSTLASAHDGKSLNSPNDLWIDPDGGVWFTDPRYGKQDGLQQGGFHVYYLSKAGSNVVRVIDDLVKPNGIIGARDGKTLYVADPGAKKTYAYTVKGKGKLSNKRLFAKTGSDGMTLDKLGNLYVTSQAVLIFAPSGKMIQKIEVPERPSNVCFGGKKRRKLFITARTSVYTLAMAVAGQ